MDTLRYDRTVGQYSANNNNNKTELLKPATTQTNLNNTLSEGSQTPKTTHWMIR